MSAIMAGCAIVFFFTIPLWKKHPIFFMLAGGFGMILYAYMPDILTGGVTTTISLTASLVMIVLSLAFWGFAFAYMFKGTTNEVSK